MRVFLTGATGFIGSRIVPELLVRGHRVLGMTRSDAGASTLAVAGAEVHRGDPEDPQTLADGAAKADAVIHCAFDHDFSNFVANCEKDVRVIKAMGETLKGSDKPLLITSGTGIGSPGPGELARENVFDVAHPNPRIASELAGREMLAAGRERLGDAAPAGARPCQARAHHAAARHHSADGRCRLHRRWPEPLARGARDGRGAALRASDRAR